MASQVSALSAGRGTVGNVYPGEMESNASFFPKGLYLSSPFGASQGAGQERLMAITATLPTVGVFARGEVLFNRSPTAGAPGRLGLYDRRLLRFCELGFGDFLSAASL